MEASAETRRTDSARMGMLPSSSTVPKASDGTVNKSMRTSGACAAAFTSTGMDVDTRSVAPVETAKDRQKIMYVTLFVTAY